MADSPFKVKNDLVVAGGASVNGTINAASLAVTGNVAANSLSGDGSKITGAGVPKAVTLDDTTTINWNFANGNIATVVLSGVRAFAAPTNLALGTYVLHVYNDAT